MPQGDQSCDGHVTSGDGHVREVVDCDSAFGVGDYVKSVSGDVGRVGRDGSSLDRIGPQWSCVVLSGSQTVPPEVTDCGPYWSHSA